MVLCGAQTMPILNIHIYVIKSDDSLFILYMCKKIDSELSDTSVRLTGASWVK